MNDEKLVVSAELKENIRAWVRKNIEPMLVEEVGALVVATATVTKVIVEEVEAKK